MSTCWLFHPSEPASIASSTGPSSIRIPPIRAPNATPAPHSPFEAVAPTAPAHRVPCLLIVSARSGYGSLLSPRWGSVARRLLKLCDANGSNRPERSGWSYSNPSSTTATTTPEPFSPRSHAGCCHKPKGDMVARYHSRLKRGSDGMNRRTRRFGTNGHTASTCGCARIAAMPLSGAAAEPPAAASESPAAPTAASLRWRFGWWWKRYSPLSIPIWPWLIIPSSLAVGPA
mmetsp:Transcript_6261/g.16126  ORF Transcript_6261/g.16126 Transcript_6261/m.16126 type:complete len:230 (+) Transcript_6261:2-691(+)